MGLDSEEASRLYSFKNKMSANAKNMVAEYLENARFQKISDFLLDLSVSGRLRMGAIREKERQNHPMHNLTITPGDLL